MTIIAIIEGIFLINLITGILFITCTGESITLDILPRLLMVMIFSVVPVFLTINFYKRAKEKKKKRGVR